MSGTKRNELPDKFPDGLRVLAIDADRVCLAYLVALLKKCKYEVTTTTRADEALHILRKNKDKFDIVITDVVRADMDGFQLLEIISLEMGIPVVMASARHDCNYVKKSIELGACDYISKPVQLDDVKKIWQHVYRSKLENHDQHQSISITGEIDEQESQPLQLAGCIDQSTKPSYHIGYDQNDGHETSSHKKPRLIWTNELHGKFLDAVEHLGKKGAAVPSIIQKVMNVPGLTRENISSHLQKYRISLKSSAAEKNNRRIFGESTSGTKRVVGSSDVDDPNNFKQSSFPAFKPYTQSSNLPSQMQQVMQNSTYHHMLENSPPATEELKLLNHPSFPRALRLEGFLDPCIDPSNYMQLHSLSSSNLPSQKQQNDKMLANSSLARREFMLLRHPSFSRDIRLQSFLDPTGPSNMPLHSLSHSNLQNQVMQQNNQMLENSLHAPQEFKLLKHPSFSRDMRPESFLDPVGPSNMPLHSLSHSNLQNNMKQVMQQNDQMLENSPPAPGQEFKLLKHPSFSRDLRLENFLDAVVGPRNMPLHSLSHDSNLPDLTQQVMHQNYQMLENSPHAPLECKLLKHPSFPWRMTLEDLIDPDVGQSNVSLHSSSPSNLPSQMQKVMQQNDHMLGNSPPAPQEFKLLKNPSFHRALIPNAGAGPGNTGSSSLLFGADSSQGTGAIPQCDPMMITKPSQDFFPGRNEEITSLNLAPNGGDLNTRLKQLIERKNNVHNPVLSFQTENDHDITRLELAQFSPSSHPQGQNFVDEDYNLIIKEFDNDGPSKL
ncbi:Two-component response regulator [Quillaja saponaria]|uniref:Two-component response regulator n=1 Tax=Quillaja saponaria TaxID=32244 RepID=A0AAD7QFI8_QUISA|nr:Two-component response regulator [Quillaja saponaria]